MLVLGRRFGGAFNIQGAAEKRPPTKTAISQNSLDILLRNFVRLLSRVVCIFTERRVCIARTMPWQDVSVCPVCLSHAGIELKRL